jgi:hypothetical protein
MAYNLILSPQAEQRLDALSPPVRAHVVVALEELAENPVSLSQASHFPYPPNCQLFRPEPLVDVEGRHEVMILFRYGQDEMSLQIIGIGHYILE